MATLNQYMERDLDALMRRTAIARCHRENSLPGKHWHLARLLRSSPKFILRVLVNPLSPAGFTVMAGYLICLHATEDKDIALDAGRGVSGSCAAIDRLDGGTRRMSLEAWVLFAILFLWQFPHFLAIAWMYREDYGRAGILMLPVVEPEGRVTGQQIVIYTLMLLPVSLLAHCAGNLRQGLFLVGAVLWVCCFSTAAYERRFRSRDRRPERCYWRPLSICRSCSF